MTRTLAETGEVDRKGWKQIEKPQTCTLPIRQEKMGWLKNCQGEGASKFFAIRASLWF
jgi:hypothetical protein